MIENNEYLPKHLIDIVKRLKKFYFEIFHILFSNFKLNLGA